MNSTHAFQPALERVEVALQLPTPARTRILRELDADLRALTERLVAEGVGPDEARQRAEEALVPRGESLEALEALHLPLYRALTLGSDPQRVLRIERLVLAVVMMLVVVGQSVTLLGSDLTSDRSAFLVPVFMLGAIGLGAALWTAFALWVKGDYDTPARSLTLLPLLSGFIMALGITGVVVDLFVLSSTLELSALGAEGLVVRWVIRDCVLLSCSILLALSGLLAWFAFRQWLVMVHSEHLDVLGRSRTVTLKQGAI